MMTSDHRRMEKLTKGLETKSEKMRALAGAGFARAEIARFLGTRYQFVRNVLTRDEKRQGPYGDGDVPSSKDAPTVSKVRLGPDGRVVVPAVFRDALGLKDGDVLFARLEGGEI